MMTITNSPTPWKVGKPFRNMPEHKGWVFPIECPETGYLVAHVYANALGKDEAEQRAAFIVDAANSHGTSDALIQWINAYRKDVDDLNKRLEQINDLPFRVGDIRRGLVLFRTSNNAHGSVNFNALTFKILEMNDHERAELAALMRSYADSISPDRAASDSTR